MPFYKMLCITAHYPEYKHIKDLVTQSAMLLMNRGAVVRSITSLGTRTLPQRMWRRKQYHVFGDYWTMHFDASPQLVTDLQRKMRTDPRVVRWTVLKLGERLEDIVQERVETITEAELDPMLGVRDPYGTTANGR